MKNRDYIIFKMIALTIAVTIRIQKMLQERKVNEGEQRAELTLCSTVEMNLNVLFALISCFHSENDLTNKRSR